MSITSPKKPNISQILGVDFGVSKIGLAIADSETRIAFAYGVLKNDKDLMKKLEEIIEKDEIGKIIVGGQMEVRPPSGGRTSKLIGEIEKFAESILNKFNIPVEYQNEMFSTKQAERNLIERGAKKIKRFDDQEAARIILQSWLDAKAKS
jgi:putative holliday junction resolvase